MTEAEHSWRGSRITGWLLVASNLWAVGCSEPLTESAGDLEADEKRSASPWVTSADGKLSLRIVVPRGAVRMGQAVGVLAELRNNTAETLVVRQPFGDGHEAEAQAFQVSGPAGGAAYVGPKRTEAPGPDSFAHLAPGDVLLASWSGDALQDWLMLSDANHSGLDLPGAYFLRFSYRPGSDDQRTAEASGRFAEGFRLWTGEIQAGPAHFTRTNRSASDLPTDSASPILVRIARKENRITAAEAAKGVRFDYEVEVASDLPQVKPLPQDMGGASGGGPSGLAPFESITGNGHSYALQDIGLGPPVERFRVVKAGVYPHSLVWDGRNWGGPSDTSTPKGEPFPAGVYTLRVSVKAELETPRGRRLCDAFDTARIILTP